MALIIVIVVLIAILGFLVAIYNGLVQLRVRADAAWSDIDVQLKRRHDLIPNLVNIVSGMRDYEKNLQTELAHLRSQLTATPPGHPGPDPQAAATTFAAIVRASRGFSIIKSRNVLEMTPCTTGVTSEETSLSLVCDENLGSRILIDRTAVRIA